MSWSLLCVCVNHSTNKFCIVFIQLAHKFNNIIIKISLNLMIIQFVNEILYESCHDTCFMNHSCHHVLIVLRLHLCNEFFWDIIFSLFVYLSKSFLTNKFSLILHTLSHKLYLFERMTRDKMNWFQNDIESSYCRVHRLIVRDIKCT